MSHEIRTPMTAILGFSDLLNSNNVSSDERRQFLAGIRRNGKALLDLINDILDLSRIEANKVVLERTDYPLRQIIDDLMTTVKVAAMKKGLSLVVDYRWPLPATIHSDPTRLRQVLANLLSNAVKFTECGTVRIAVRCLRENPDGRRSSSRSRTRGSASPRKRSTNFSSRSCKWTGPPAAATAARAWGW